MHFEGEGLLLKTRRVTPQETRWPDHTGGGGGLEVQVEGGELRLQLRDRLPLSLHKPLKGQELRGQGCGQEGGMEVIRRGMNDGLCMSL